MLHEFAIDPYILNNWETFRYYYEKTGIENGRLISEFPKKWKKFVYEACDKNNCTEMEKKRIEVKLNKKENPEIDDKFISLMRPYNPDFDQDSSKCWLLNAETQHSIQPFHLIISNENPRNNPAIEMSDSIEEGNRRWHIETEKAIPRTSEALINCVSLLFRISKKILFIDPHFNPNKARYKETLKSFLQYLIKVNPSIERIEFHSKIKRDINQIPQTYNSWEKECKELPNLIPSNMSIKLIRWDEYEDGERLHARYILTDKGGFKIDWGIDQGRNENETTDVSIMSKDLYIIRWNDYQQESSPYNYIDELLIKGNR